MNKIEELEDGTVKIDGVEYARVKEAEKQDIRDYCRERGCWAAMDMDGRWFLFEGRPHLGLRSTRWELWSWHATEKYFAFPIVPWNKSLIASDGSMPLMKPEKPAPMKWKIKRGDPVFVWNDDSDDTIPALLLYFHSKQPDGYCFTFSSLRGERGIWWQHYRKYDPALVGVARKDWPKEEE